MATRGVTRFIVCAASLTGTVALPTLQAQGRVQSERGLLNTRDAEPIIALAETAASASSQGRLRLAQDPASDKPFDPNQRWAKAANDALNANGIYNVAGVEANLCSDGKLLPAFYLLGGPKCATTSMSMEMGRYGGVHAAPHLWSSKEWHFWEQFMPGDDAETATSSFRDALGGCPDERLVLGDFSVNNLLSVPEPLLLDLSPCSCDDGVAAYAQKGLIKGVKGGDVPRLMSTAYGGMAGNVTLMMMLRSPLERMQSSWYHAQAEDFPNYWGFRDCCTTSFNDALKTIVNASDHTQDPPVFRGKAGGEGSVWASMYGRHIYEYMQHFSPAQMIIAPYKQYMDRESRVPMCAELSKRLKIDIQCGSHEDFHENVHPHPTIDADIDPNVKNTLMSMFETEHRRLVEAIASASKNGAYLPGYSGEAGNSQQINAWLERNW